MNESSITPTRVLVTGGAGFIGSHLCERLVKEGNTVISLDNYFTGSIDNHVPGVTYRTGHTKNIEQLIPEHIDIVYHLGEYSRVEKSFEDLEIVWDLNKTGTFAVLEFIRLRGCKLIYAGSSTKFADEGLGKDQSPYAWTKATNTELVKNYGKWFGITYAITYFYNVYGPRERAGAYGTVIEIFRQNYIAGRPNTVTLPGTQKRNFTHIHDIVDGLVLVGFNGEGDEFGLGSDTSYSIVDVANMFGNEIVYLPERAGNRLSSVVHTEKSRALGWSPKRNLASYIEEIKKQSAHKTQSSENRILIFATTFYPTMGPAEQALYELIKSLPLIMFDVVTTAYSRKRNAENIPLPNVKIHYVGGRSWFDKFLLPFLGAAKGAELTKQHRYLFIWSLMASYGAFAAISTKRKSGSPLLVTLADQSVSWRTNIFLHFIVRNSDQVYTFTKQQEQRILPLRKRMQQNNSFGTGDAFVNQIRFAYSNFLKEKI